MLYVRVPAGGVKVVPSLADKVGTSGEDIPGPSNLEGNGKSKVGTLPEVPDRGLSMEEVRAMLGAPRRFLKNANPWEVSLADRDSLILSLLWETWTRVHELVAVRVENIDLENRIIHLVRTKRKVTRNNDGSFDSRTVARDVVFTEGTRFELMRFLGNRRKGPLFLGNEGKALTQRAVRKMIHKYAVASGAQGVVGYDKPGNPRFLVTPKAFREAGEAWAIIGGMDRDQAARYAGHTRKVQEQSYAKYDVFRAMRALEMSQRNLNNK